MTDVQLARKGNPLVDAVIESLGLDADAVKSINIHMEAMKTVIVTAECYLDCGIAATIATCRFEQVCDDLG